MQRRIQSGGGQVAPGQPCGQVGHRGFRSVSGLGCRRTPKDAQTAAQKLVTLAGSRSGNELDAIHVAVICLPASERRERADGRSSPEPAGFGARVVKRKSRLADYLSRPAFVSGISRTDLVVTGLVIAAVASVAISLFLLLKDPGGRETEQGQSSPTASSITEPRLQYRDLEPRPP